MDSCVIYPTGYALGNKIRRDYMYEEGEGLTGSGMLGRHQRDGEVAGVRSSKGDSSSGKWSPAAAPSLSS
jgi:hypothetical protein